LEAKKRNLDPKRIIFAERTENIEDHLARLELADIYLDTFPYNAHSTTYDNIRAGLPMVTMMGNSFASRVAASIYSSINMNELIAKDKNEYEKIAVELGTNKEKLTNLKNKIKTKTKECISINSIELTKNLENVYIKISKKN
jgi:predicted O-linked N-acetylglucosamine transferase (SPINDLY family)